MKPSTFRKIVQLSRSKARPETLEAARLHLVESMNITASARTLGVDRAALHRVIGRLLDTYQMLGGVHFDQQQQ